MTTRRDAIARNLCARICDERRSIDELRVVDAVLSGLERGADVYGPLDLATDPRDWQMEIAEERRDELVYRSCALLSKRDELLGTSPTGRTADFDSVDCGSSPQSRSEPLGDRSIGRTPRSERVNPGSSPGPRTSAPARADVSLGNPQAGGGTFSCDAQTGCGCYIVHGPHRKCSCGCHSAPSHPSNGSQRVGGGCSICGASFSCDCAAKVSPWNWVCPTCDEQIGWACWSDETGRHYHGARLDLASKRVAELRAVERGLRELAAAKPQVAAPGVAMEWDMTDLDGDE